MFADDIILDLEEFLNKFIEIDAEMISDAFNKIAKRKGWPDRLVPFYVNDL